MTKGIIRTVTGDILPLDLGYCQCHEHLFIAKGLSGTKVPSLILDDYPKTLSELELYFFCGGRSLVDAQPVGCGRMAAELLQVSLQSGVQIIASTGFHKLDFYGQDHFVFQLEGKDLEQLFISELTQGMFTDKVNGPALPSIQSQARAGIIKVASDGRDISLLQGNLPVYKKLFMAAGGAAAKTGAPVMTHLEMGQGANYQLDILLAQGVKSSQIIMSHLDRLIGREWEDYQFSVARSGVYLQLDTIGRLKYHSDEEEAAFINQLCEKGFSHQILLGLDTTNERFKSYGNTIGLDYIMTTFRHTLHKYGIGDELIHSFTFENPKRALCWEINES